MTNKVPNIRFKGFTDDWEQRKVRDVADRFDNLRIPVAANLRVPGTTPYYGANGIQDYVEGFTHDGEFVLVAEDGANDLKNYPVKCVKGRIWVNNHAHVLQGKQNIADNQFLAFSINRTDIESLLVGGGRAKLNAETMMDMSLSLPKIEEQRSIGNYISTLDHLITLHQRKCEQTKELKKFMLQKMFPKKGEKNPEIRFPGFTDDWEQRKLGEIAERVQGNDGRMDLPTLTISAANGWMDQKERFSGNIAGKEQKKYTLLHKGELSYNHGNSKLAKYGTVFSLETYEEALVPRVYHSFKVINGSSKFIEYYFATKIPDRELAKLVSSGARMDGLLNINFNEFMGINLTVPNKSEQEKISNYFSNLDHLITLHQRKCEQLKELKKFMLQNMFPKKG
ncbi:type I restriction enzyme, S subunit [Streptococcus equinus]|nr:type I restriction enzyme, S subunit [Streptococcus equinus]